MIFFSFNLEENPGRYKLSSHIEKNRRTRIRESRER